MRKILTVILSLLMLSGVFATAVSAYNNDTCSHFYPDNTYLMGDANSDGAINALDSNTVIRKVVGFDPAIDENAADFDADGKITSKDNYYYKLCFSGKASFEQYETAQTQNFLIGSNSISEYDITVPKDTDKAKDNAYFAAEVLQTTIAKVCGYEPDICFGEGAAAHHINIHKIDPFGKEAAEGFGVEHYEYDVKDGDLNIYGSLRGNMYAAYEICEKYLGVRYVHSDRITSLKQRYSQIPEGTSVSKTPILEFRYCGQRGYTGPDSFMTNYIPNRMNGTQCYCGNSSRVGYLTGPEYANAHSYGDYYCMADGDWPAEDYTGDRYVAKKDSGYAKNPDITAYSWQPCASDDAVYELLWEGFLLCHEMSASWSNPVYDTYPYGIETASFSINDNGEYCNCRICSRITAGTFYKCSQDKANKILENYSGIAEYTTDGGQNGLMFRKEGASGLYLNLTNRAARDAAATFPGMRIMTIIYDHSIPETVRPESNIVMLYCGHGCNNHIFGSGDCGDNTTYLHTSNKDDEISAKVWADMCHEAGASVWFWSYDVNYTFYLIDTPCLFNIYYDFDYLINTCHFDGYYYEGQSADYVSTEKVKAYIAQKLSWDPSVTYDEFTDLLKEALYLYYGKGYEYIYQFLVMMNEAGDEMPCFINNHDRPGDMYSYKYINTHYEEMRALLDKALLLADEDSRISNIYGLYMTIDFLGLSSSYTRMYTNGDEASRKLYTERYDRLYNYLADNEIPICGEDVYSLPDEIDYSENIMTQFYEFGSWNGYSPD